MKKHINCAFYFLDNMSKNNTIKRSDKKFIRLQKAKIRAQFFDFKKQQEMINELYSRFNKSQKPKEEKAKEQREIKTVAKVKKETVAKKSKEKLVSSIK